MYFPGVHHRDTTSYEFSHIPELMLSVKNFLLHEFAARPSHGASLFLKFGRNSVISYKGEVPQSNDIVQSRALKMKYIRQVRLRGYEPHHVINIFVSSPAISKLSVEV